MDKLLIGGFFVIVAAVVLAIMPPSAEEGTSQEEVLSDPVSVAKNPGSAPADPNSIDPNRRPEIGSLTGAFRTNESAGSKPQSQLNIQDTMNELNKKRPAERNAQDATQPQSNTAKDTVVTVGTEPGEVSIVPRNAKRIDWPVVTQGEFAVEGYVDQNSLHFEPAGIPENDYFERIPTDRFKMSVDTYFTRIKEDGAELPSAVAIDKVFPDDLIKKMKIPEGSEMTMLGKFGMDKQEAYTLALAQPNDQHGLIGISYVTPDGLKIRRYIRLESDIGR